MTTTGLPHVWLAYVPYPVTTAVYLERALRKSCRVTTVGPLFPPELIETWHLQNLKLPSVTPDICTEFVPDMASLLKETPTDQHPDLYLWVESVGGYFPENLDALRYPTACWLIDTHLNLPWHPQWAKRFDFVFLAQRAYVQQFRDSGMNAHWLPLACDPEVHTSAANQEKQHQLSFVGSLSHNPRRQRLLKTLDETFGIYCERCWWDDMARVIGQSRITFNNAVKNDLNMRVFEALSIGTLLLTDRAPGSGLEELFHDGEELAIYRSDEELIEVARFYQNNPLLQEQIARRGRQVVHQAHTYAHRAEDLLAVTLGSKPATWTAAELREQSVAGLLPPFETLRQQQISIASSSRSFVIPVLDYSPASPYNIVSLLKDLETIPGEVIVVFNNPAVADDLQGHPRITRSATISENIGVARAWNVGISMATTPYVMILNADLHLENPAVDAIEQGLGKLPDAACVGPQGSFVNYRLTRDFLYFDKGSFDQPIEVDAVSGFLFGIKRELFGPGGLKFEEAYTPCYFEEWDLGLQIKQAGLKSWIVPATAYDHRWGGTIGGLRTISCLGREETAQVILQRNRQYFLNKWRDPTTGMLPASGWLQFGPAYVRQLLNDHHHEMAHAAVTSLLTELPDDRTFLELGMQTAFALGMMPAALSYSRRHAAQEPQAAPARSSNPTTPAANAEKPESSSIGTAAHPVCVIVITSEQTWQHLATYCCNQTFRNARPEFDLCIVFNGSPAAEARRYLDQLHPDHTIIRRNFGMDPAALDAALRQLPDYRYYLVLHDDHWFTSADWLVQLVALMEASPDVAAFGNLVVSCPYNSQAFDQFFAITAEVLGYPGYLQAEFPCYLQGMAGMYRRSAIESILHNGGVPHTHSNHKKTVEVCERLLSYVLLKQGAQLRQLPPGYELFLRHRKHNSDLAEELQGSQA